MENKNEKSAKKGHINYAKHLHNTERYFCENCTPYDDNLDEYDNYRDEDNWLETA